ncbi:hypothetical protein MKX79_03885 [Viridibacillus sp. FSL R5-0468]|uniref:hypothetical protein n=1 Tax=Viridibacillus sp. FSL R5-0468 TaxID=2921640 RepID=UPI0030FAEA80
MVKYYYNKYNAIGTTQYVEPPWTEYGFANINWDGGWMYKGYSFDTNTADFSTLGGVYTSFDSIKVGDVGYSRPNSDAKAVMKYVFQMNSTTQQYIKKSSDSTKNTIYSQGSLISSNIIAEDGTYPLNGRHADGNWYVRGAVVNTAPTTPGAFSQPTSALEIGDSKAITWGTSTDAESNLKNYVLEASLNGGAWTQIGTPTSASFMYTIPSCTSIQFRVKAVDTAGLESAYMTSVSFGVTKPKYFYSKYNATSTTSYIDSAPWVLWGDTGIHFSEESTGYIYFSSSNGYSKSDAKWGTGKAIYPGDVCYSSNSVQSINKYVAKESGTSDTLVPTVMYYKNASQNTTQTNYSPGSLVQSGIIAEDGTYPNNYRHTDGYWYVRGSRVNASIAPTGPFTAPVAGTIFKPNQAITATFEASTAANISAYEVDYRYNSNAWSPLIYNNSLSRTLTTTTDKTLTTLQIRVRAKNTSNVYSDYIYSDSFVIEHNVVPTLTLNTENNKTLYENDTFLIDGSALDKDNGNIVNVKYQLNGGQARAITTEISNGTKPIDFSKQLIFKDGKLYDGDTAITDKLVDGVAHTLRVFAEDDQGGKSVEQIRSFFVVPNRAPAITINPIEKPTGVIDSDKFPISGACSDPDGNDVIVSYKINTSLATEIYRGKGGDWTFDVSFSSLKIGENIIIVEVIDSHNFKTSKTIKLNKAVDSTPILNSVVRYKIKPPTGSAKGVLLCVQKDKDLNVSAEISMTETGVQEHFVEMPLKSSTPPDSLIAEDVFTFEATEAKDNIYIKLNLSRESDAVDTSIKLIWGSLL